MTSCPTRGELEQFLEGKSPDERFAAQEAHIEHCEACQSALKEMTADDAQAWLRLPDISAIDPLSPASIPIEPFRLPPYVIEEEGRRGGLGIVYRAFDPILGRNVALKGLLDGKHAGPDALARLRNEAHALGKLRHPNIVTIHDIKFVEGLPILVMEWMDGGSLADQLRGEPRSEREAALLVATIAEATSHAHGEGVLHRDIKPANILLPRADDLSDPKLSDFNLSKLRRESEDWSASKPILGTPCYMSPEMAQNRGQAVISAAADVYSLGAVLYEMLTGRPPFRDRTDFETIKQVAERQPVPPREFGSVHPDLEAICLKCLAKDPADRFPTAQALAENLRQFLQGQPVRVKPPRWLARRTRPNLVPVLAALSAALVCAIGAVLYYWRLAEVRGQHLQTSEVKAERFLSAAQTFLSLYAPRTKDFYPMHSSPSEDEVRMLKTGDDVSRVLLSEVRGRLKEERRTCYAMIEMSEALGNIRHFADAQALCSQASAALNQLRNEHPQDPFVAFDHATSLYHLAYLTEKLNQPDQSLAYRTEAVRICVEVHTRFPTYDHFEVPAATWSVGLAKDLEKIGEWDEAEDLYRKGAEACRRLAVDKKDSAINGYYAHACRMYALFALKRYGDVDRYLAILQPVWEMADQIMKAGATNMEKLIGPLVNQSSVAVNVLYRAGREGEALASARRALEWSRKITAKFPENDDYRYEHGSLAYTAGLLLHKRNDPEAAARFQEAARVLGPFADHARSFHHQGTFADLILFGPHPATRDAERGLRILEKAVAGDPGDTVNQLRLAIGRYEAGQFVEAEALFEELNRRPDYLEVQADRSILEFHRAMALQRNGRKEEAERMLGVATERILDQWKMGANLLFAREQAWRLIQGSEPPPLPPPKPAGPASATRRGS